MHWIHFAFALRSVSPCMGVTRMKLTYGSLWGKGPIPNPLCVEDKESV